VLAERSELRDLWRESPEYAEWLATMEDLRARIGD